MRNTILCMLLLSGAVATAQSKAEMFKRIETLLNKTKGEVVDTGDFGSTEKTLDKQIFSEKALSYSYIAEGKPGKIEYLNVDW